MLQQNTAQVEPTSLIDVRALATFEPDRREWTELVADSLEVTDPVRPAELRWSRAKARSEVKTTPSYSPVDGSALGTITIFSDGTATFRAAVSGSREVGVCATKTGLSILRGVDPWTEVDWVDWVGQSDAPRVLTIVRGASTWFDLAESFPDHAVVGVSTWTAELFATIASRLPQGWHLALTDDLARELGAWMRGAS